MLNDVVWCKVFPTSLKGANLEYFMSLSTNSINCFTTIGTKFGAQFATSQPHNMISITLVNIKHEKDESLQMFMNKFKNIAF